MTDYLNCNELVPGGIAATISQPRLLQLHEYWLARNRAGRLPGRVDIDPVEMTFMLGNLILVDVERAKTGAITGFRYRLIGANLVDRLQIELTGRLLAEHPDVKFREIMRHSYEHVVQSTRPVAVRRALRIDDRNRTYEAIYFPLASDGWTVDMVLVGVCFSQ